MSPSMNNKVLSSFSLAMMIQWAQMQSITDEIIPGTNDNLPMFGSSRAKCQYVSALGKCAGACLESSNSNCGQLSLDSPTKDSDCGCVYLGFDAKKKCNGLCEKKQIAVQLVKNPKSVKNCGCSTCSLIRKGKKMSCTGSCFYSGKSCVLNQYAKNKYACLCK